MVVAVQGHFHTVRVHIRTVKAAAVAAVALAVVAVSGCGVKVFLACIVVGIVMIPLLLSPSKLSANGSVFDLPLVGVFASNWPNMRCCLCLFNRLFAAVAEVLILALLINGKTCFVNQAEIVAGGFNCLSAGLFT